MKQLVTKSPTRLIPYYLNFSLIVILINLINGCGPLFWPHAFLSSKAQALDASEPLRVVYTPSSHIRIFEKNTLVGCKNKNKQALSYLFYPNKTTEKESEETWPLIGEGLDFDLLYSFAKSQNRPLLVQLVENEELVYKALQAHSADIGVGNFSNRRNEKNELIYLFKNHQIEQNYQLWFQKLTRDGELKRIMSSYQHIEDVFLKKEIKHFQKQFYRNLPLYLNSFKIAGDDFSLPWQMIAAIAFQESQWNKEAVSYTGVKGLMMLTEKTAQFLGVKNRNDFHQSLFGGSKYFKNILNTQESEISWRQKIILSLLAYNLGPAHLEDLMYLALEEKKDPYSWKDLRPLLILVSQSQFKSFIGFSSAKGLEAIQFVERVLAFYDLLSSCNSHNSKIKKQRWAIRNE